ncbi:phospholipase A2, membrane associated-like [Phodopus roborovskii]|uniref:phospholipase A2, membrane associated-like n=1 Tax=Phodopus roborovskii TaxID=109678 RepID=UPI0021E3E851|nr:phospholipase A2, membrane associated-like [Phodopus roborovskii]
MPRPVLLHCSSQTDNMKVLLLLAVLIMAFGPIQVQGSLVEFWQMIWLKTGQRPEIRYAFYGCHCGVGGKGTPIDETDWCCFKHDCCYARLEELGCGTKFLTYDFDYKEGQITCSENQDSCRKQLCQCDKHATICFYWNWHSHRNKYQKYAKNLCRGKTPSCSERMYLI